MYVLLRMPFKVYPLPCFIIFLPECWKDKDKKGTGLFDWISEKTGRQGNFLDKPTKQGSDSYLKSKLDASL